MAPIAKFGAAWTWSASKTTMPAPWTPPRPHAETCCSPFAFVRRHFPASCENKPPRRCPTSAPEPENRRCSTHRASEADHQHAAPRPRATGRRRRPAPPQRSDCSVAAHAQGGARLRALEQVAVLVGGGGIASSGAKTDRATRSAILKSRQVRRDTLRRARRRQQQRSKHVSQY